MVVRWGDLVALYAAGISTYTAFHWILESRPYLTVFQPDQHRAADSITIRVHNPGRKMIFIVGHDCKIVKSPVSATLLKVTPRGNGGFTPEYAAYLLAGILRLAIAPGASEEFSIGPVYEGMNVVVTLRWHRAGVFDHLWPHHLTALFNPLKVRVTPELEALIFAGRIDLKQFR